MTMNTTKDSVVSMLNTLKKFYDQCMSDQNQLCERAKTFRENLEGDILAARMEFMLNSAAAKKSASIVKDLTDARAALSELNNKLFPPVSSEDFRVPFEEKNQAPAGNGEEREINAEAAQAWEKLGEDLLAWAEVLGELGETLLKSYSAHKDAIGEDTYAAKVLEKTCESIRDTLGEEKTILIANAQSCDTYKQDILRILKK